MADDQRDTAEELLELLRQQNRIRASSSGGVEVVTDSGEVVQLVTQGSVALSRQVVKERRERGQPPGEPTWAILYSLQNEENPDIREFWVKTRAIDQKILDFEPVYVYRLQIGTGRPSAPVIGTSSAQMTVTDGDGNVIYQRSVQETWTYENYLTGGTFDTIAFASSEPINYSLSASSSIASAQDSGAASLAPDARVEVASTLFIGGPVYITQGYVQAISNVDPSNPSDSASDEQANSELPFLTNDGLLLQLDDDGTYSPTALFPLKQVQSFNAWITAYQRQLFVLIKGTSVQYSGNGRISGGFTFTEYPGPGNVQTNPRDWRAPLANVEVYEGGNGACVDEFIEEFDVSLEGRTRLYRIDLDQDINGQTLRTRLENDSGTIASTLEIIPLSETESACNLGNIRTQPLRLRSPGRGTIESIAYYPASS